MSGGELWPVSQRSAIPAFTAMLGSGLLARRSEMTPGPVRVPLAATAPVRSPLQLAGQLSP